MSEMHVRRLVYSDLPAVLAIERRAFDTPWSLAMFVLELSKPWESASPFTDREAASSATWSALEYADVWHLMNIAVTPERRREGIARRLLERLFDEAGEDARYTLEVRTSNHGAIAMYEQLGFRRAGHRRRYYHDNGEDALIMWLESPRPRSGLSAHGSGLILAIETSCDDTCAAVADGGMSAPT